MHFVFSSSSKGVLQLTQSLLSFRYFLYLIFLLLASLASLSAQSLHLVFPATALLVQLTHNPFDFFLSLYFLLPINCVAHYLTLFFARQKSKSALKQSRPLDSSSSSTHRSFASAVSMFINNIPHCCPLLPVPSL